MSDHRSPRRRSDYVIAVLALAAIAVLIIGAVTVWRYADNGRPRQPLPTAPTATVDAPPAPEAPPSVDEPAPATTAADEPAPAPAPAPEPVYTEPVWTAPETYVDPYTVDPTYPSSGESQLDWLCSTGTYSGPECGGYGTPAIVSPLEADCSDPAWRQANHPYDDELCGSSWDGTY